MPFKTWNWEVYGDLNSNITRKSAELQFIQPQMSNLGFSEELFLAESRVHRELDVLLRRHECFYHDRSRVKWLKDGDHNSSFFHASVRRRQYMNALSSLSINGVLTNDSLIIMDHIIEFIPISFLRSSRLSVLINGSTEGYFHCSRGVRHGDLFPPLLFGIAEDFLSRLLSRMVDFSKLLPISSLRGFTAPTHLLYADDVMIFYRGTVQNLKNILIAFEVYGNISGQLVNWDWSVAFLLLGDPVISGKPKKSELQLIADKILSKFAKWKGKSLYLAGRATLIKLVITDSFVHSFMIYKWSSSLLRLVNRKLRNFLWTGSYEETKLIQVAWDRCCKPYSQGGLGLKDLGLLNDSLLKKLTWKFMTSQSFAFSILRERYLTQLQKSHDGYVTSSIWPSFRSHYSDLLKEGIWLIGENSQRDFWHDNWLGVPILELLGIPDYLASLLRAKVYDFTHDGMWVLDDSFRARFSDLCFRIDRIAISPVADFWCGRILEMGSESFDHLFLRCPLAAALWEAVFLAFQRSISVDSWSSFFSHAMSVSFTDQSKAMKLRFALSLVWRAVSDDNWAPVIRSVIWSPPAPGWIKVNTDGAALSSPGVGGCWGVFRNCRALVKGCFAVPLGQVFAFEAELLAALMAINLAWQNGWHRIWLESESSYVVYLLASRSEQVPWWIRQAWQHYIYQISKMEFQVSHIFREGNQKNRNARIAFRRIPLCSSQKYDSDAADRVSNRALTNSLGLVKVRSTPIFFQFFQQLSKVKDDTVVPRQRLSCHVSMRQCHVSMRHHASAPRQHQAPCQQ
ncbi:hypothetical protein Dsin_029051 [Dipteronia sinensis]|uniref:RNase H type-1 domain-containing protein n=1 Tax=Dipteronia sinensis TaxID=43782 RepID=A0AAE0DV06_9ROSI|nr:hypothetical protein Dsin_029051 [Dipteronia sinensis]